MSNQRIPPKISKKIARCDLQKQKNLINYSHK